MPPPLPLSTMEIPSLYKKLRYSSNSHSLYSLFSQSLHPFLPPKTLVLPKPSPIFFFGSNQFHTKPTSSSLFYLISSTGPSSVCAKTHPVSQSSQFLHCYRYNNNEHRNLLLNLGLLIPYSNRCFRSFSASAGLETVIPIKDAKFVKMGIDGFRPHVSPKQVSEIIDMIMKDGNDLESKLDSMNVSLSVASITEIFRVLNCEKVSAFRFFGWIRGSRPELSCNSDVCSLVIDNCGWLDDYEAMLCVLSDVRMKQVHLTKMAFGFIPVLISNQASIMQSLRRVVDVLNEAGGSCRTSGVRALIEMLCVLGSFEMAKFVMEITERRTSYYNILIREKCRRCDFEGARDTIDEMRQVGCDMIVNAYNYLLSSLCKNDLDVEASEVLKEMQEKDCLPDALTFEIFIFYLCRLGKFDLASKFLDKMVSQGLEPRHSTHAALIKGYFNSHQYEEAYKYVVDSSVKYRRSSNSIYSLLASLHQKKGNGVIARNILFEMINKGIRPDFAVYKRALKHLNISGREDLARDLESRFSSLSLQSSTGTG